MFRAHMQHLATIGDAIFAITREKTFTLDHVDLSALAASAAHAARLN
jgi:hypothetical protein